MSMTPTTRHATDFMMNRHQDSAGPLQRSKMHADEHRKISREHWQKIAALRTLFGDGIAHALELSAEQSNEQASEAIDNLRQVIDLDRAEAERERFAERSRTSEYSLEATRLRQLLRDAVRVESARRRRGAAEPVWLVDARAELHRAEEAPF